MNRLQKDFGVVNQQQKYLFEPESIYLSPTRYAKLFIVTAVFAGKTIRETIAC